MIGPLALLVCGLIVSRWGWQWRRELRTGVSGAHNPAEAVIRYWGLIVVGGGCLIAAAVSALVIFVGWLTS